MTVHGHGGFATVRHGTDEPVLAPLHAAGKPPRALQGKGVGIVMTKAVPEIRGYRVILAHIDNIGRMSLDQGEVDDRNGHIAHMQGGEPLEFLVQHLRGQIFRALAQPASRSVADMIDGHGIALLPQIKSNGQAAGSGPVHGHRPGAGGEPEDPALGLCGADAQAFQPAQSDGAAEILAYAERLAWRFAEAGRDGRKRHALLENGPCGGRIALGHGLHKGPGIDAQGAACPAGGRLLLNALGFPLPEFLLVHAHSLEIKKALRAQTRPEGG